MKKILIFSLCFLMLSFANAQNNSVGQTNNQLNSQNIPEFAYSFLGAYIKTLEYQEILKKYCAKYDVDFDLVFAIAMYESGGHNDLTSVAGAKGLLQIMPDTQKSMKTKDAFEGGVKYLAELMKQFPDRIDKVIVAYNGGPKAARSDKLKMESLQYLQGVSLYLRLIKQYRPEIETSVANIKIYTATREDKSWADISLKLNEPILELRLFNPFLIVHGFKTGSKFAYPQAGINFSEFTTRIENNKILVEYTAKMGDIYQYVVNVFSGNMSDFRYDNGLWHNSQLFVGEKIKISIPLRELKDYTVQENDSLTSIAIKFKVSEWDLILANGIFDQKLTVGQNLKIAYLSNSAYEVRKGDTLYDIAQAFRIDLKVLAKYNSLKSPYILQPGMKLVIPQ